MDRLVRVERFTRSDRLRRRREFDAVYSRGTRVPGRHFVLLVLPNEVGNSRLGMTVSRKVGGAVVRNRVRRLLREIFRKERALREAGLDLVVHAKPGIVGRSLGELTAEFREAVDGYVNDRRRRKR